MVSDPACARDGAPDNTSAMCPAVATDGSAILRCARAAYQRYVAAIAWPAAPMVADLAGQLAAGRVHVAIDPPDALAGCIVCYPDDGDFHVENVAVMPAGQGRALAAL